MSDKILTEAFDKLKAIEESDDPFCLDETAEEVVEEDNLKEAASPGAAELVYKSMDYYLDSLENMESRLDGQLGKRMEELGMSGERAALQQKLQDVIGEFGDFMPGLEMQVRGE